MLLYYRVDEGVVKNVSRLTDEEEDTLRMFSDSDLFNPSSKQAKHAGRVQMLREKERVRAKSVLERMRAHISNFTLRVAAYVLFKLLRLILRTVQVSPPQVEKIRKASDVRLRNVF